MEAGHYHGTYSGTPQGGVVSAMLMNVYLHELDRFVGTLQETFNRGIMRRANPQYVYHRDQIAKSRKRIDALKSTPDSQAAVAQLRDKIAQHGALMRRLPSQDMHDPTFKRLKYLRYADDTLLGVIGSKAEAEHILHQVRSFLAQALHLEVNEEKTHLSHITEGCEFLGYRVRQSKGEKIMKGNLHGRYSTRRTTSAVVNLYVPDAVPATFCHKQHYGDYARMQSRHRTRLLAPSVVEIILTYNAELRGLAQYYALACDGKTKLAKLFYLAHLSLYKTLACKLRTRSTKRVRQMLRQPNGEMVGYYWVKGVRYGVKIYQLKHLVHRERGAQIDSIPCTARYTRGTTELITRLNADTCEYCSVHRPCEVHHVRKLKDLKRHSGPSELVRLMIARARKTIVLCPDCHMQLHNGTLPDRRHLTTC